MSRGAVSNERKEEMDHVRAAIAKMYRRITLGCYSVHPIPSGDFYLVTVKKL